MVIENAGEIKPSTATLLIDAAAPLPLVECDRSDFQLYHFSPVLRNGWAVIGETSKWVPISTPRIRSVTLADDAPLPPPIHAAQAAPATAAAAASLPPVSLQLSGAHGEEISFGFVDTHAPPTDSQDSTKGGDDNGSGMTLPIQYVKCTFGPEGTLTMTPSGCVDGPW